MKKIFVLAIMAMITLASQAQIVSSRSSRVTTTNTLKNYENFSTIYLQYNPISIKDNDGDTESFTGFSLGYNHAFSLSQSVPLYLEPGLGIQYAFHSKDRSNSKVKYNMFSTKIPVSLLYKFDIANSEFSIVPNAGIDFRINLFGKYKREYTSDERSDKSLNLFSEDDMGDGKWNRFQIGWHVGVNFMYANKFLLGASYGTDFSKIQDEDELKVRTFSLTLGYCF
ncbi:MAG: porin family protein [Prevotella sp.]|nr:porin family protein [Prevotella sp.]